MQGMEQIRRIMRPTDVPDTGLLCDLLWSDPDKDVQVYNYFIIKHLTLMILYNELMMDFSGMGRERPRSIFHVRSGRGVEIPKSPRHGSHLSGASGGGGRLRVLCQEATGHPVLSAQLLRRVRQCRRHDERGRHAHV